MINLSKWSGYGLMGALALTAGLWVGLHNREANAAQGDSLPFYQTRLTGLDGQSVDLNQWKGKRLLVNFWATWCAPCVQEMPELSKLQNEVGSNHLQIIGIGIDSADNIKGFVAKFPVSYPLYVGGLSGSQLSRQLGDTAGGLPFTVIIGADGKIEKTYMARLDMARLRADLGIADTPGH